MIPKKIHYCWFGGSDKPLHVIKCINSWKKYCPDYEIIEWNENNVDISQMPVYTRQAYEQKKWAFVSDYIRVWVVHNEGGLYFDTDVEAVRNFDSLLNEHSYFGFEDSGFVALGLGFGAEKGNIILKEILEQYDSRVFVKEDGSLDLTPSPAIITSVFLNRGLCKNNKLQSIDNVATVFPTEYFCPFGYYTGKLQRTSNTYSIHWFDASWQTEEQRSEHLQRIKEGKKLERKNDFLAVKKEKGLLHANIWVLKDTVSKLIKDFLGTLNRF